MNRVYKFIIILTIALCALVIYVDKAEEKDMELLEDYSTKYSDKKDFVVVGGSFEEYKIEKLSYADTGKVILFFNASWCPSCSDFEEELKKVNLPDDVLLLNVDYDTNTELRRKYEVALQHSFIQVDSKGGVIKKWSGGGVERLKKELGLSDSLKPATP